MATIKLGIIGTGRIARRAVSEIKAASESLLSQDMPALSIEAVINPNLDHAKEYSEEYGIEHAVSKLEDASDYLDAVYIATPHHTHYEYASAALTQGMHVICEKPMSFSAVRATHLYDLADTNGLVLMEAVKTAYCPGFKRIQEIVMRGDIGDVVDVDAAFTRLTPYDNGCREYSDKDFGGSFTEFGSYPMLPVFRFLGTGNCNLNFMSVPADNDTGEVDGFARAVFDFGNRTGSAKTGLTVKSEGQLVISGTNGYILAPSPWWLTKFFEVRYEDPSKVDRYECEYEGDGLRYEFEEFGRRVSSGLEDSIYISAVIERREAVARAHVFEEFLKKRNGKTDI